MGMILICMWVLLLAWTGWYLLTLAWGPGIDLAADGGPPPDPYAAAIDAFRRELHDWDRRGRA